MQLIHTAIWCVFVSAIFYILYAGIFDNINALVWVCVGLILMEGIILLICKWRCPLTLLSAKYTSDQYDGFDIFIPKWLARHNKTIFTSLFVLGLALVLWRILAR